MSYIQDAKTLSLAIPFCRINVHLAFPLLRFGRMPELIINEKLNRSFEQA